LMQAAMYAKYGDTVGAQTGEKEIPSSTQAPPGSTSTLFVSRRKLGGTFVNVSGVSESPTPEEDDSDAEAVARRRKNKSQIRKI